jgi:hypothetical protein
MTLFVVKLIDHLHCIIPGISKAVKVTARRAPRPKRLLAS